MEQREFVIPTYDEPLSTEDEKAVAYLFLRLS
jgi:hypothetical protein